MRVKKRPAFRMWAEEAQKAPRPRRCCVCLDPGKPVVQELLAAIQETKAFQVTVRTIYEKACKEIKGFRERVGFYSFRMHLGDHEPLWHRPFGSRGRSK